MYLKHRKIYLSLVPLQKKQKQYGKHDSSIFLTFLIIRAIIIVNPYIANQ